DFGEELAQLDQLAVFAAEIVAPVADAVGLVDGEGADSGLLKDAEQVGVDQPFRRDEYQSNGPITDVLFIGKSLNAALRTLKVQCRDTARLQAVHLILHKGDERRDDDGGLMAEDGGGLIAERFAATGGQDNEGIAAVQDGSHGLFLERPQGAETPVTLDN